MRDERDFYGMTPPCRVHRGRSEGVDPAIYAGPLAITKENNSVSVRGYCINCGVPLNWVNCKKNFLCHVCEAKWHEGVVVVAAKNNILGVPRQESIWEDKLGIVRKIFKNGGLKLKF